MEQGNVLDINSNSLDGISSHVASACQKAMDMYDARAHLEEQIVKQDISDSERHQQFLVCNLTSLLIKMVYISNSVIYNFFFCDLSC